MAQAFIRLPLAAEIRAPSQASQVGFVANKLTHVEV